MNGRTTGFAFSIAWLLLLVPPALCDEGEAQPTKRIVRANDGLSIVCEVRGKGDTALVFLHGWCGDRGFWKHQVDEFAAGYRVVAIDHAGHGESGKDRQDWSVLGLAEDVEVVVEELGLRRVILVGHSMSGPISLAAAKRMPEAVVAVIGVETLHNAEYKTPEEQSEMFLKAFETDFKGTIRFAIRGMLPENAEPELLESTAAMAEKHDPKMAVALLGDVDRVDLKALFEDSKVPVRCINAGPGFQFHMPTASEINKKYADFGAVIMEGVGHFPMLEQPAEFNRKLRGVLEEFVSKK